MDNLIGWYERLGMSSVYCEKTKQKVQNLLNKNKNKNNNFVQ